MRPEILQITLIAGGFTWALRFLPTRADLAHLPPQGLAARLLGALGPAAIATLFAAELLPQLLRPLQAQGPLVAGIAGTLLTFRLTRSVVGATLAGGAAYGLIVALGG